MRRKVIQHFADIFCQRIVQLPDGYDLAAFVHYGSGTYKLNILSGECSHTGEPIPTLRTCDEFREWLFTQLDKHNVPRVGIDAATLTINLTVSEIAVKQSFGNMFASAHFSLDCSSEILTDEKSYRSSPAIKRGASTGTTSSSLAACWTRSREHPL
jgi:hypothetical protein